MPKEKNRTTSILWVRTRFCCWDIREKIVESACILMCHKRQRESFLSICHWEKEMQTTDYLKFFPILTQWRHDENARKKKRESIMYYNYQHMWPRVMYNFGTHWFLYELFIFEGPIKKRKRKRRISWNKQSASILLSLSLFCSHDEEKKRTKDRIQKKSIVCDVYILRQKTTYIP